MDRFALAMESVVSNSIQSRVESHCACHTATRQQDQLIIVGVSTPAKTSNTVRNLPVTKGRCSVLVRTSKAGFVDLHLLATFVEPLGVNISFKIVT